MKTIYKVLLALGALLSVTAVGLFLLVRGALGVADHAVDVAANGVDKLTAVAAKQTTNIAQAAKAEIKDAPEPADAAKGSEPAPPAPDGKPAENASPAALPANSGTPGQAGSQTAAVKPTVNKSDNAVEDDLADVGQLFKMLISEGDESDGDTAPALPGAADKGSNGDGDSIAGLVPGGDSPTLRGVMAGKYKGNEGKIIDDALEDPKAWRLLFFLGGGM